MKYFCKVCGKEQEFEEKNIVYHRRIDNDSFFDIECKLLVCSVCGDKVMYRPNWGEMDEIARRMRRARRKLLHWEDILEFQKMMGWTNQELGAFINRDGMIVASANVDETLPPEIDKKLRDEMEKNGYKPKWDTIEL